MLVRGVDEDGVAGRLAAHHEDVVLVRTDDELVDADVGRFVVRRTGHRGEGTGPASQFGACNRARSPAWKLDRSVK